MSENKEYSILVDSIKVHTRDVDDITSKLMCNVDNWTHSGINDKEKALELFNQESSYTWVDFKNYFKNRILEFHNVALLDVWDVVRDNGEIYCSISDMLLDDYLYMLYRLKDLIYRYNNFPNCTLKEFIKSYIVEEGYTFKDVDIAKSIIYISYKEITLHLEYNQDDECVDNIDIFIDDSIVDIGISNIEIE